jgi:hypothetical protein
MLVLINAVVFQVAWLVSVIGGAQQMPWLGPVAVLLALALHVHTARKPFEEILLVVICALIGAGFDSILVAAGWVTYKAGLFSDHLARWLRGQPKLAALLGFYGGPASYLGGQALGGIVLSNQVAALMALAVGWAIMMPILMWLSENLDGMPGRRRSWIAESTRC